MVLKCALAASQKFACEKGKFCVDRSDKHCIINGTTFELGVGDI